MFHWSFDHVLLSLGPLQLRWYGLMFVGSFWFGAHLLKRLFMQESVEPTQVDRLLIFALLGTIVGARLVHCFFYAPGYYLAHPLALFRIWEGGLASHGGAIGLLLGLSWAARSSMPPLNLLWLIDRVAIPAALGAAVIRVANFLNSEILGEPTSGSWGVVFDQVDPVPRHPVQLYEAGAYLLVLGILLRLYQSKRLRNSKGLLFGSFLVLVFGARLVAEQFKTGQASVDGNLPLSMGQMLSFPFVALGLLVCMRALSSARRSA